MAMNAIYTTISGIDLHFVTAPSLFSPTRPDRGSLAMLSRITFQPSDKILDLGCGYGLMGIYAAKIIGADQIWMIDNDPIAVDCAIVNAAQNAVPDVNVILSDGFNRIRETNFTKILCNPPYHADFSVPKHFIEKAFNRLVMNGAMYVVTKRKPWYRNKLLSIFGNATIYEENSYLVFQATKRSFTYAKEAAGRRRAKCKPRVPCESFKIPVR